MSSRQFPFSVASATLWQQTGTNHETTTRTGCSSKSSSWRQRYLTVRWSAGNATTVSVAYLLLARRLLAYCRLLAFTLPLRHFRHFCALLSVTVRKQDIARIHGKHLQVSRKVLHMLQHSLKWISVYVCVCVRDAFQSIYVCVCRVVSSFVLLASFLLSG